MAWSIWPAQHKAEALVERFGERGFDYAGNSVADLPVWEHARRAIVVNASASCKAMRRPVPSRSRCSRDRVPGFAVWRKVLRVHQWLKNTSAVRPLFAAHRSAMPVLAGLFWRSLPLAFAPRRSISPTICSIWRATAASAQVQAAVCGGCSGRFGRDIACAGSTSGQSARCRPCRRGFFGLAGRLFFVDLPVFVQAEAGGPGRLSDLGMSSIPCASLPVRRRWT